VVLDGQTVLDGQFIQVPEVVDFGVPLVEAVEEVVQAVLTAAHDRG
jgi:hypothetical protein